MDWDVVEDGRGGEAIWSALKRKTNFQTEENVRINKQKKFISTALLLNSTEANILSNGRILFSRLSCDVL